MARGTLTRRTAAAHSGRRRASIGALGVGLTVLVILAWATCLPYLAVRAGLAFPLRLAIVDSIHVYVGLASVSFLVAKLWRIGVRTHVEGVTDIVLWHRWLSAALGVLYAGVYLTGVLVLVPWPASVRTQLVDAHLIASVWAAVPTTWHAWHHRRMAAALLRRPLRSGLARRVWLGIAITLLPAAVLLAVPRALSPLTVAGAGSSWTPVGPRVFLDRMEASANGRWLVAAGDGLFVRSVAGGPWGAAGAFSKFDAVLALELPQGPAAVAYVGTGAGLSVAAHLEGPYRRLPFPGSEVHGIAIAPDDPRTIWATSRQGIWRSQDAGQHWALHNGGLSQADTSWAVRYVRGALLASDVDAVYRWTGSSWALESPQRYVVSLTVAPDGRLYASSMGDGIRVRDGSGWHPADDGLASHSHGDLPGVHVISVTVGPDDSAYAGTMFDGVAVSVDGGRSWYRPWTSLRTESSDVWRVIRVGQQLIAATDRGVFTYTLPQARTASLAWWSWVLPASLLTGMAGVAVAALPRRARGPQRPFSGHMDADRCHTSVREPPSQGAFGGPASSVD